MIFKKKKEKLYFEASKVALENSKMIYDESKLLNDRGYSARSFTLSIISLEESAKAFLFRLISVNLVDEIRTMKFIHDHENKLQQSSQILVFSTKFAEYLLDLIIWAQNEGLIKTKVSIPNQYKKNVKAWAELSKMVAKFHKIKLDSIYVGIREGKIIDPNIMFQKDPISEILEMVEMQVNMTKVFIDMPDSQILEIWKEPFFAELKIKHLLK